MFGLFKRKQISTSKTVHQALLNQINLIRPERMSRVFFPNNSTVSIRTTYKSIQEYNLFLKHVLDGIKGPGVISDFLFRNPPMIILLRDWFVYNNTYLQADEHTKVFIQRATELVTIFAELESNHNESTQRLVNQISPVISQLREIIEQMSAVSKFEFPSIGTRKSLN